MKKESSSYETAFELQGDDKQHADIHDIQVIFVDEKDEIVNPLGAKGLGEIGIVGVAAAVGNAIYHATGNRVRDLRITLDKLMTTWN